MGCLIKGKAEDESAFEVYLNACRLPWKKADVLSKRNPDYQVKNHYVDIKLQGTPFYLAKEYVGIEPRYCID